MKLDSQGEKPRSVTIPLDWGKAKKLWSWLRRKREPTTTLVQGDWYELPTDDLLRQHAENTAPLGRMGRRMAVTEVNEEEKSITIGSAPDAPEDMDISPEDMKLLKLLDAQNKDWKASHDKP